MNPGVAHEAGETARGVVGVMKDQPLSLALVVMNLALLALFWYFVSSNAGRNRERDSLMYSDQRHVRTLLAFCKMPEGGLPPEVQNELFKLQSEPAESQEPAK